MLPPCVQGFGGGWVPFLRASRAIGVAGFIALDLVMYTLFKWTAQGRESSLRVPLTGITSWFVQEAKRSSMEFSRFSCRLACQSS